MRRAFGPIREVFARKGRFPKRTSAQTDSLSRGGGVQTSVISLQEEATMSHMPQDDAKVSIAGVTNLLDGRQRFIAGESGGEPQSAVEQPARITTGRWHDNVLPFESKADRNEAADVDEVGDLDADPRDVVRRLVAKGLHGDVLEDAEEELKEALRALDQSTVIRVMDVQAREDAWYEYLRNVANHLDGSQVDLYHGGAERGDPDAQFQLARLLKEGVGVRLNRVDAYKWLELAATQQADEDIQRRASTVRRLMALEMTQAEIARGRNLAAGWAAGHRSESDAETAA